MQALNGVKIAVVNGGRELRVDEDGFIHNLNPAVEILIRAIVAPDCNVHPMVVNSSKKITLLQNVSRKFKSSADEARVFEVPVPVELKMKQYTTAYPRNNMRFLELVGCGQVRLWEASVISQANENRGDFFFALQIVYEEQCYRDGNKVACPKFQNWPDMLALLDNLLGRQVKNLPPIQEYLPGEEPHLNGLCDDQGLVLWFNEAMGAGALRTVKGVVKVRRFGLRNRHGSRRKFLLPGELVAFKRLEEPESESRTSFTLEALGVRALNPPRRSDAT